MASHSSRSMFIRAGLMWACAIFLGSNLIAWGEAPEGECDVPGESICDACLLDDPYWYYQYKTCEIEQSGLVWGELQTSQLYTSNSNCNFVRSHCEHEFGGGGFEN